MIGETCLILIPIFSLYIIILMDLLPVIHVTIIHHVFCRIQFGLYLYMMFWRHPDQAQLDSIICGIYSYIFWWCILTGAYLVLKTILKYFLCR